MLGPDPRIPDSTAGGGFWTSQSDVETVEIKEDVNPLVSGYSGLECKTQTESDIINQRHGLKQPERLANWRKKGGGVRISFPLNPKISKL